MAKKLDVEDDFETTGPTLLPELDNAFRPIVLVLKRSAIAHLIGLAAGIVGFGVVLYTAHQITEDLKDRKEERLVREDERRERAWTRLRDPIGGQTGKGDALSVLLDAGIDTAAINLSCAVVGTFADGECKSSPVFSRVRFPKAELPENGKVSEPLEDIPIEKFEYSTINRSDLTNYYINISGFNGAIFTQVEASSARFDGNVGEIVIFSSDVSFAIFDTSATTITLMNSNVSGALFSSDRGKKPTKNWRANVIAFKNWAWADAPPMQFKEQGDYAPLPEQAFAEIKLCDPKTRRGGGIPKIVFDGITYERSFTGRGLNGPSWTPGVPPRTFKEIRALRRCEEIPLKEAYARYGARWYPKPHGSD